MTKKLISVIVPVYKVEKYLDRCIGSVVNQTYQNLEIILVDDGSPDGCPAMCDEWAKRDSRIRVVHKENGGISSARNAGLESCTGEYIGFIDSDDYAKADMVEKLYCACEENNADIAFCGYYIVKETDEHSEDCDASRMRAVFNPGETEISSSSDALALLCENKIQSHLWNKLFKKDLFNGIRFPYGKTYEDVCVLHKLFMKAQRIVNINQPEYFYLSRNNSITGVLNKNNISDLFEALLERYNDLKGAVEAKDCVNQLAVIASFYIFYCQDKQIRNKLKHVKRFLLKEKKKYNFKKALSKTRRLQWNLNAVGFSYYLQYKIFKRTAT